MTPAGIRLVAIPRFPTVGAVSRPEFDVPDLRDAPHGKHPAVRAAGVVGGRRPPRLLLQPEDPDGLLMAESMPELVGGLAADAAGPTVTDLDLMSAELGRTAVRPASRRTR